MAYGGFQGTETKAGGKGARAAGGGPCRACGGEVGSGGGAGFG